MQHPRDLRVAVLGVFVFKAGKNDGKLTKLGDLRIMSQDGDYKLIYAVSRARLLWRRSPSAHAYYIFWRCAIAIPPAVVL